MKREKKGLQFLHDLYLPLAKRHFFVTLLEERFNNCLDLLGTSSTSESLQDCLLSIGLELLNQVNETPKASSKQVMAMRSLALLVVEQNTFRDNRILFLKFIKKYYIRRT